jgi:hypothetical protein
MCWDMNVSKELSASIFILNTDSCGKLRYISPADFSWKPPVALAWPTHLVKPRSISPADSSSKNVSCIQKQEPG